MTLRRLRSAPSAAPGIPVIRGDLLAYRPQLVLLPGDISDRSLTRGRVPTLQGGMDVRGGALVFDGVDDYISVSGGSLVSSTSHTLMAVCTLTASPTNYNNVTQYENSSGNNRYLFYTTDAVYGDLSWGGWQ